MARRRLQIVCSSSDDDDDPQPPPPQSPAVAEQEDEVFDDVEEEIEDEDEVPIPSHDQIPNLDSVTLDSSLASAAVPDVVISDEEFVDVPDNLSPPPEQPASATAEVAGAFVASDCPVNDWLRKMGVCLKREWLDSCKFGLQNSIPGFVGFDVETKAKLCFGQALNSDMNYTGAGVLPPNVHQMHLVELAGPFVLQVRVLASYFCLIYFIPSLSDDF